MSLEPVHPELSTEANRVVVVGYDGSPAAQRALLWAAAVSHALADSLRIIHAVEVDLVPGRRGHALHPLRPSLEVVAETLVGGPSTWPGQPLARSRVRAVHAVGGPADELVDASRTADLVVLGTRGRGRTRSALVGSVSCTVAAQAYCPVVVLHEGGHLAGAEPNDVPVPGPAHEVVCGVSQQDGEAHVDRVERIVAVAARVAAACGAPLRLVTVEPEPRSATADESGDGSAVPTVPYAVSSLTVRHPGLAVATDARRGDVVETLLDTSRASGLLVVGAPHRAGARAVLAGTPSYQLIHGATCPVMLVP